MPQREALQKFALDHAPSKSKTPCTLGGNHRSDYIGARALLSSLPNVDWLLGDRGYDADWFRDALKDKGIRACILGRKQRKTPVKYDKRRYKRRYRIKIMVRQAQGLEARRDTLRPLSQSLPLNHRARSNRHLSVRKPEPKVWEINQSDTVS